MEQTLIEKRLNQRIYVKISGKTDRTWVYGILHIGVRIGFDGIDIPLQRKVTVLQILKYFFHRASFFDNIIFRNFPIKGHPRPV